MNSKWSLSRRPVCVRTRTGRLVGSFIVAGLFASPALSHFPIPPKKAESGRKQVAAAVADFSLRDQENNIFRFQSSRGKVVLVTFIYTTCPDVCSLLTAKFASIQRALKRENQNDYLLLSLTTDPQRDTAATLKSYAERFRADFRHWRFLTGPQEKLQEVWEDFGVVVRKFDNGQVQHTALTTLIDRQGKRRVDYYGDKWQEKEILRDISVLESQSRK